MIQFREKLFIVCSLAVAYIPINELNSCFQSVTSTCIQMASTVKYPVVISG